MAGKRRRACCIRIRCVEAEGAVEIRVVEIRVVEIRVVEIRVVAIRRMSLEAQ